MTLAPWRVARAGLAAAAALGMVACTYKVVVPDRPAPPPPGSQHPALVALLGSVDLRQREGGAKTHEPERVPGPYRDPTWDYPRANGMNADPFAYGMMSPSPQPTYEVRLRATGNLGTSEVMVPLLDGFSERFRERLGDQQLRDATQDPLAEQPDPARAVAFLTTYPGYAAAVWVEVLHAKAELPDHATLANLFQVASICSLGGLAWLYLIPMELDTPVDIRARAFLVRRDAPTAPLGAAVQEQLNIKAKGSVAFDVETFRADVASAAATLSGIHLADQLLDRPGALP